MRLIVILLLAAVLVGLAVTNTPPPSDHAERLDALGPSAVKSVIAEEFDVNVPDIAAEGLWQIMKRTLRFEYRNWYLFSTLTVQHSDDDQTLVTVGAFNNVFVVRAPETWLGDQVRELKEEGLFEAG